MVMVMMKGNRTDLEIQIHKICETNPNVFQKYQNVVAEILGLKCYLETFWKGAKNLGRALPPSSKHLKGRLDPPVGDVTFLYQRRSIESSFAPKCT